MSHTSTAMTSASRQQLKTDGQPSQALISSPGDRQKVNAPSDDIDCGLDEPPEWFVEATRAVGDAMAHLYDNTSSQFIKTTSCMIHALSMLAKLSNVLVRRAGLNSGYDIVPFVDGSWPPNELPPLVSDDVVDTLGQRERLIYLEGYGVRDWDEETWRPLLFEAIGAPIDLPWPDELDPMEL
ncbi:hypothetical protein K525DRAFT_205392 [Schizophyllum commune Loenen D]|nr:hypothetical protein K525DRAFT_205392 [Schizophyllum commune Loenen D]